jgi:KUP system potassium uptake protein
MFVLMAIWRGGVDAVRANASHSALSVPAFQRFMRGVPRVPGTAIFLTRQTEGVPNIITDHVRYMGSLHEHVIALTVVFEQRPRVPEAERSHTEPICDNICRVTTRFGFVESPDLTDTLAGLDDLAPGVNVDHAIFFANRDMAKRSSHGSPMPGWQLPIFTFLFRNAVKVVDRFSLPAANVLEVGREIEI